MASESLNSAEVYKIWAAAGLPEDKLCDVLPVVKYLVAESLESHIPPETLLEDIRARYGARGARAGADNASDEEELPPLIQAAIGQFEVELPQLLRDHRGKWVVYHGATRLGFGETKTDLLRYYYAQGYSDESLYVRKIEEPVPITFAW
jgi:hypothetical protein